MDRPIEINRSLFEQHCRPRFGGANPERMVNPYWEWEIRREIEGHGVYPSKVRHALGIGQGEDGFFPTWTFYRMGSTRTVLVDGARVFIAGEHEDWYDPDFCIYNDVIVVSASAEISIFGYPRELFPPTDFHTATLVGDRILVLGSLGYPEDRRTGMTQVFALHLADYSMERLPSEGDAPGWIHHHEVEAFRDGEIEIRGGIVLEDQDGKKRLWRNHSKFAYAVSTGRWRIVSSRYCRQWLLRRQDRRPWAPGAEFEFEQFLTADELRDSEKADDERIYGRRQFTRNEMTIEMDLDFNSLELAIEGEGSAEDWSGEIRGRLAAACGAECEMVERGR
jgi:hypothetical protein